MEKKKARTFYILIFIYAFLVIVDGALTYYNTPTLEKEGNPLVFFLGWGWPGLIVVNLITAIAIAALGYYSYIKYKTVYTNQTKITRYLSEIFHGDPDLFWKGGKVKSYAPVIACLGYAMLHTVIAARCVIVMEWLLSTFKTMTLYYLRFKFMLLGRVDLVVAVIVCLFRVVYWFRREFKLQLKAQMQKDDEDNEIEQIDVEN